MHANESHIPVMLRIVATFSAAFSCTSPEQMNIAELLPILERGGALSEGGDRSSVNVQASGEGTYFEERSVTSQRVERGERWLSSTGNIGREQGSQIAAVQPDLPQQSLDVSDQAVSLERK